MADTRKIAYASLLKCEKYGKYTNIEIDSAIEKNALVGNEKAFFTALVYGVLEKKLTLDYIIGKCSSIAPDKLDTEISVILRMGIYQLLYMKSVPSHAACNESVELCRFAKKKSAASFVNAILRRVARGENIEYPDANKEPAKYLSVYYSFPEWLCEMWIKDYGFEKCESILNSFSQAPHITLRTNTLKITREKLLALLEKNGIKAEEGRYAKHSVRLMESVPVSELECLSNGYAFVQDEASQVCAEVLDAVSGDVVIDVCACPGGKSFSTALNMDNIGSVISFDLHENKLSLIKKGASKLGIDIIKTACRDGRSPDEDLKGFSDRVLVDAPCSGLGVVAKKPDLRYKEQESTARLPNIQYGILNASAAYLKKGGVLVYSTCTLNRDENDRIAERFLREHSDFTAFDFDLGNGISSQNGCFTFYPDEHNTDGFFVARFKKY